MLVVSIAPKRVAIVAPTGRDLVVWPAIRVVIPALIVPLFPISPPILGDDDIRHGDVWPSQNSEPGTRTTIGSAAVADSSRC